MLILTRKIEETVLIGEYITVTILDIRGSQVRIGITAPKSMSVDRNEIRAKKDAEKREGLERDLDGNRAEFKREMGKNPDGTMK